MGDSVGSSLLSRLKKLTGELIVDGSLRWSFDDGLWTAVSSRTEDGWVWYWRIEVAEDGNFGVTISGGGVAPVCHDWHPSLACAKHQCECWEREFRNLAEGASNGSS